MIAKTGGLLKPSEGGASISLFVNFEKFRNSSDCCFHSKPYHSWERGSSEDLNGLIRQCNHPKQTDFDTLSDEFIQYVDDQMNSRRRKRFNFDSPNNVFERLTDEASIAFMG